MPPSRGLSDVHIYDPVTHTWSKGEDLPRPRFMHETFVINGKVYVMGGAKSWNDLQVAQGKPYSVVDVYDLTSGTWTTEADMPTPRADFTSGVVDGKIYIISGIAAGGWKPVRTVEEYTPSLDVVKSVNSAGKLATTWGQIRLAK